MLMQACLFVCYAARPIIDADTIVGSTGSCSYALKSDKQKDNLTSL